MKKYEPFFNKQSSLIHKIKKALDVFCPNATNLKLFFKKIALIATLNNERFDVLTKRDKKVILAFQVQLAQSGFPTETANSFFGCSVPYLQFISPCGSSVSY